MNPLLILQWIETAVQGIAKLSELITSLQRQIDEKIPDDQLGLESLDETVERLKAEGKIPADYEFPR